MQMLPFYRGHCAKLMITYANSSLGGTSCPTIFTSSMSLRVLDRHENLTPVGKFETELPSVSYLNNQEKLRFVVCLHTKDFQMYEVHKISFQTFFVWALLLIVRTWNSSLLRSNLVRLQCSCCIVPTTSRRPHGSPLVWACQWPSSQPLSSPQLSHNDRLWA